MTRDDLFSGHEQLAEPLQALRGPMTTFLLALFEARAFLSPVIDHFAKATSAWDVWWILWNTPEPLFHGLALDTVVGIGMLLAALAAATILTTMGIRILRNSFRFAIGNIGAIPLTADSFIRNEIQKVDLEPYHDYGQNLFDRYVAYTDAWIEGQDFKDPDTGQLLSRELLNQELTKFEKPAGIANPTDFRNEVVKFSRGQWAFSNGRNPSWTSHEKVRYMIEKLMFSQVTVGAEASW